MRQAGEYQQSPAPTRRIQVHDICLAQYRDIFRYPEDDNFIWFHVRSNDGLYPRACQETLRHVNSKTNVLSFSCLLGTIRVLNTPDKIFLAVRQYRAFIVAASKHICSLSFRVNPPKERLWICLIQRYRWQHSCSNLSQKLNLIGPRLRSPFLYLDDKHFLAFERASPGSGAVDSSRADEKTKPNTNVIQD
jgi:hypothetical protein